MFCRCRYDDRDKCALKFDGEDGLSCYTSQGREKKYEFERIYNPSTTQEKVHTCKMVACTQSVKQLCYVSYLSLL